MNRRQTLRPRIRAIGLLLGAMGMGLLGTYRGMDPLVWFAVGIGVLLVLLGAYSLFVFIGDRRIRARRVLTPAQPQVGVPTRSELLWPPGYQPPSAHRVVDHGPGPDFTPDRRGHLSLGPVMFHRGDPFGLFRWRSRVRDRERVVVWPRVDAVRPEVFTTLLTSVVGTSGSGTPEIDDLMLREYQHGDPMSRVYWKRLSSAGQLLVRREEPAEEPGITLVLVPGQGRATDLAVDVLASAVMALAGAHRVVRVLAGDHEEQGGIGQLLTFLALTPCGEPRLPVAAPTGVVLIAVAEPDPAVAGSIREWVGIHGVDSSMVAILVSVSLDHQTHSALEPFTVVGPWSE